MNKIIKASGTSHNRTVYAAPAVAGLASIRLGRLRLPGLIPAHFASPGLATQALIRTGKTSHTTGTLCEMPLKFFKNIKGQLIYRVYTFSYNFT
jgi:hypothetical protein